MVVCLQMIMTENGDVKGCETLVGDLDALVAWRDRWMRKLNQRVMYQGWGGDQDDPGGTIRQLGRV